MSLDQTEDWDPGTYARFRGLRLRPAIDLLMQVPTLPHGDVVDLGCGNGAVGPALAARFSGRRIVGIDKSPAMLADAEKTGAYARLVEADVSEWSPDERPALIFSNALCHWLPDHAALFPRLAGMLVPRGSLAVQMPRQYFAPSHTLLRDLAQEMFPDRFDFTDWQAPIAQPEDYIRLLSPYGTVNVWKTEYLQRLDPVLSPGESGHPVRRFTQSTAMRPFMEKLDEAGQSRFVASYDVALERAYPAEPDGTVLFPFQRVFFLLTLGD